MVIFNRISMANCDSATCPDTSISVELIADITVEEQQPSPAPALQQLVDKYFEEEILDGENKYHCDKCEGLREAVKRTSIPEDRAPQNLIVSLKRFKFEASKGLRVKVSYYGFHQGGKGRN